MTNKSIFLRSAYNYDTMEVSNETAIDCSDAVQPSLCVQSEAAATDINNIIRAFGLGHELPVALRAPTYGDFIGVDDFHSAQSAIAYANQAFMELPADIRARFNNNAGEFVDFTSDDKNRSEAESLGLVFPKPAVVDVVETGAPAQPDGVAKPNDQ